MDMKIDLIWLGSIRYIAKLFKWAIEKIWLILNPAHSSAIDSELADARPRLVNRNAY
jgi:hypothetical protein